MTVAEVESWLDRRFINVAGTASRQEDRTKAARKGYTESIAPYNLLWRARPGGAAALAADAAARLAWLRSQ